MDFSSILFSKIQSSPETKTFFEKITKRSLSHYMKGFVSSDSSYSEGYKETGVAHRFGGYWDHSFSQTLTRFSGGDICFKFTFVDAGFEIRRDSGRITISQKGFNITKDEANEIVSIHDGAGGHKYNYLSPVIGKVISHFESVGKRKTVVALVSMMIVGSVSRDDKTILSAKECVDSLVSAGFDIGAFLGTSSEQLQKALYEARKGGLGLKEKEVDRIRVALSVLFEKTVSDEDFLKVFQAIDSEVLNTSIEAGEDIINAIPKIFEISGGKSASQDKKKFAFIGNILETLKGNEKTAIMRIYDMYAYGVGLNTTRSLIPNGHSLKNHHVDDISAIYSTRMVQKISESFKEPEIKKFSDIADHIRDIQFKTVVSESARFSNGENSIHTLLSEQGNTLKATRVFVLDSEKIIGFDFEKIGEVRIHFDTISVESAYSTGFSKTGNGITEYGANSSALKVAGIELSGGDLKVRFKNEKFVFGPEDTFKDSSKYELLAR